MSKHNDKNGETTSTTTVPQRLRQLAMKDPQKPAFIFYSDRDDPDLARLTLTRLDLLTLASRFAARLRKLGVKVGDLVCNTLPNGPERLITDLGIMTSGAVALNGMVFLSDGADLLGALDRSGCVAMVIDLKQPRHALNVLGGNLTFDELTGDVLKCERAPRLKKLLQVDCGVGSSCKPFLEELRGWEGVELVVGEEEVTPDHFAFVLNTSGSTGFSKLVPRTHATIFRTAQDFKACFELKEDDINFNDRSLGWMGGLPFLYLLQGVTRVMTDLSAVVPTDPLALAWKAMRAERCSIVLMVPLHIDLSMARPELWKGLQRKLRVVATGGQPVRKHHVECVGKFTDKVSIVYGMTEMSCFTSRSVTVDDKGTYKDGDNGCVLPGYKVKFVDKHDVEILEPEKSGEVLVRSDDVMFHGYMSGDDRQAMTSDGYFRTGDVGYFDSKGHIYIVCRKSNGIFRGAFVVYPGWLESRIEKCPGVQNVIVVPVPDSTLFHELCACILPKPGVKVTEQEVKDFCKSIFLVSESAENSMVPRYYLFFDSFPTTVTGKTDRRTIRKLALPRLGIQDEVLMPNK